MGDVENGIPPLKGARGGYITGKKILSDFKEAVILPYSDPE